MENWNKIIVPSSCRLCQWHQKLETNNGTAFWIEWDESGLPHLCMDSTSRGGSVNTLVVKFCPACGRKCEILPEQEADHGEA